MSLPFVARRQDLATSRRVFVEVDSESNVVRQLRIRRLHRLRGRELLIYACPARWTFRSQRQVEHGLHAPHLRSVETETDVRDLRSANHER